MEKTALEKRIEERATKRLLSALYDAYQKEQSLVYLIGKEHYESKLLLYDRDKEIYLKNDFTKEAFERLLPKYISIVTDELLSKVDEMQWLLEHPNENLD